jgi:5-phospho-D-xylono-1,4-lactonase
LDSVRTAVLPAVADAHARTGAQVMVHLEHGSAAFELLEVLASDEVRPEAVLLAHIDRNPDPGVHAELAAGAYLGCNGFARTPPLAGLDADRLPGQIRRVRPTD